MRIINKRIVVLLFLFYCITLVKGQSGYHEWVDDEQSYSNLNDVHPFKNNGWLLSGINCYAKYESCDQRIIIFDSSFKIIRQINTVITDKIIIDKNNNIISIGEYKYGDVISPIRFQLSVLNENLDTLITKSFYERYQSYQQWGGSHLKGLCLITDSTYLMNNDSVMMIVSSKGIVKSVHKVFPVTAINYILPINSNLLLLVSGTKIFSSDSTGNLQNLYNFKQNCTEPVLLNDTIYIGTGSLIYRLDQALQKIDSFDFGYIYLDKIEHLKLTNGHIWLCGNGGQLVNRTMVLKLTGKFSLSETWVLPDEPFKPTTFFEVNEPYFLIGNEGNYQHLSIYTFNSESFDYPADRPGIKLDSLGINSYHKDFFKDVDTNWYCKGVYFTADFKVTNNSNRIINSLFAMIPVPYIGIERPAGYKKFSNLNLTPGKSITLSIDEYYYGIPPATIPICFYVLLPDDLNESDFSDNSICDSFTVVGLNDNLNNPTFKIYPNPADEFICINLSGNAVPEKMNYFMINSLGVIVKEGIIKSKSQIISLNDLAPGCYYLRISNNSGSATRLFVHY